MQLAITFIAVVAGLAFSLAVAVVTEELIFGQIVRMFFHRNASPLTIASQEMNRR